MEKNAYLRLDFLVIIVFSAGRIKRLAEQLVKLLTHRITLQVIRDA